MVMVVRDDLMKSLRAGQTGSKLLMLERVGLASYGSIPNLVSGKCVMCHSKSPWTVLMSSPTATPHG